MWGNDDMMRVELQEFVTHLTHYTSLTCSVCSVVMACWISCHYSYSRAPHAHTASPPLYQYQVQSMSRHHQEEERSHKNRRGQHSTLIFGLSPPPSRGGDILVSLLMNKLSRGRSLRAQPCPSELSQGCARKAGGRQLQAVQGRHKKT